MTIPLMVEFSPGSRIEKTNAEPIPGTQVVFPDGSRLEMPCDQVVLGEDERGSARIGLGGMSFEGIEEDQLVFWRVRDLLPEEFLEPSRPEKLSIRPGLVTRVVVEGDQVWPARQG